MTGTVEERIGTLVAHQHGVVARRQLLGVGLSPSAIGRRLSAGRMRPLHRGVYLVGSLLPPKARLMAAVLAGGPTALLSHFSAAVEWQLTSAEPRGQRGSRQSARGRRMPPASDAGPVDISVEGANRGHRPGIRVHRVTCLRPDERTVLHGIPITTPGRTLIDLAPVVATNQLEGMLARADRHGLVDREGLRKLLARHPRRPGVPALKAILELHKAPAFTRSEAESRFLQLARRAGLPRPDTNVTIGQYEIDFLWRAEGVAVEVDGYRYHSSRSSFEGDRRRDAWLLARGVKVVRLSWRQITEDAIATAVLVGQALARSRT